MLFFKFLENFIVFFKCIKNCLFVLVLGFLIFIFCLFFFLILSDVFRFIFSKDFFYVI